MNKSVYIIIILKTPVIEANFCRYPLLSRAVNTMQGACESDHSYFKYTNLPLPLNLWLRSITAGTICVNPRA